MNLSQSNLTYERLQGRAGGTSSVGQVAPFRRYRLDKSKTPRVGPLFHVSGPAPAPNLDRTYNLARQRTRAKDTSMGLTYANLKLTNLFSQASIEVNAWVDCGATFMCIPENAAAQLGFDTTEVSQQLVTLANGHQST